MDKNTIKLFSSKKTDHWQTPEELYLELHKEFDFSFDPCPLKSRIDYLKNPWGNRCFVNPPYSKVKEFLIKAQEEIRVGNTELAAFLIFSNTDTAWFHDFVKDKAEIRFLRGRLKFVDENDNQQNSAMRPSMLCIFRGKKNSSS